MLRFLSRREELHGGKCLVFSQAGEGRSRSAGHLLRQGCFLCDLWDPQREQLASEMLTLQVGSWICGNGLLGQV